MQPDKNFPESGPSEVSNRGPANAPAGNGGGGRSGRRKTPDREVPLYSGGVPDKTSSELLNRWLDGEVPESTMLATTNGDDTVDLWNKIHDEAELLRSRTTPLYVHKRIMDSLPEDLYQRKLPWYKRPVALNPFVLVLMAVGMVVVGVVVSQLLAL